MSMINNPTKTITKYFDTITIFYMYNCQECIPDLTWAKKHPIQIPLHQCSRHLENIAPK
uniref:Uncharacterized protein n=1 Tax=Anguilla anguilla TaxID=7936 RepID=A0A0E9T075_ANGAN